MADRVWAEAAPALAAAAAAKTPKEKLAQFKGFHFRELKPDFPGVAEPRTRKSMGEHCEDMAKEWSIARDSQDELAAASHHKARHRLRARLLDDLVVSFRASRATTSRADTSLRSGDAEAGVRQGLGRGT